MKKIFIYIWKLPKTIYCKINEFEMNFLHRFNPEYKSKLALHCLIFMLVLNLTAVLSYFIFDATYNPTIEADGTITTNGGFLSYLSFALLAIPIVYIIMYLKNRLPMIEGRKWGYCIMVIIAFSFGGNVILLPIYILAALLVVAFYIVIAIIAIWIVLFIISGGSGNSGNGKKRKWKLENGDEVTEEKGLMGESYYRGSSGKDYETDNGGQTFTEK